MLHFFLFFVSYCVFLVVWRKTMEDEILTVDEVAAYLKLAKKTIYKLVSTKELPAFRIGKFLRFKKAEVVEWLNNKKDN